MKISDEPTVREEMYMKLAGTSAVLIKTSFSKSSPIERDGPEWSASELNADAITSTNKKGDMATVLALEGLEEYDPPSGGDMRFVKSIGQNFIYSNMIKAWIQI